MKASAPTNVVWILSLILGILGIIGYLVSLIPFSIPVLTPYAFWFVLAGFVLLAIGTSFKGV